MKKNNLLAQFRTRSFRVGGYSVLATAVVLAIVIAVNCFAQALPTSMTQFDITSAQLFSISEQTENIVSSLQYDVEVYWIVRAGQEDSTIQTLLDRYDALSEHLSVTRKDPDVYPTFVQQYTTSVEDNSLVVTCGDRYRYVSYSDIYLYDYTYYYYTGSYEVSFAGENALTSAIAYVTNEDLPVVYYLTGHGECTLPSTFQSAVEQENMSLAELSLLTVDEIPADADCILICAPSSDISAEEKEILLVWLENGGSLYVITQPPEDSLPNLEALLTSYGLIAQEGIVVESDRNYYAMGAPYYLLPGMNSHTITSPLIDAGYYVLLPVAQGITVADTLPENLTITELLYTSDSAFSKVAGYDLSTYEREDGDIDGPFCLAAAVADSDSGANIVWISSAYIIDETANSQVSGGNQDLFINALGWMCEHEESISIHAKGMNYEYLTIDSGMVSVLTVLVIGVIPLGYLALGLINWIRRKRR